MEDKFAPTLACRPQPRAARRFLQISKITDVYDAFKANVANLHSYTQHKYKSTTIVQTRRLVEGLRATNASQPPGVTNLVIATTK